MGTWHFLLFLQETFFKVPEGVLRGLWGGSLRGFCGVSAGLFRGLRGSSGVCGGPRDFPGVVTLSFWPWGTVGSSCPSPSWSNASWNFSNHLQTESVSVIHGIGQGFQGPSEWLEGPQHKTGMFWTLVTRPKYPPYRETGVAIPLLHWLFYGIADYRCYTPTSFNPKTGQTMGVLQKKLAPEAYHAIVGKDQKGPHKRGIHDQGDFWKFPLETSV